MEIYLDNSATTKPYEEVIEVMSDVMRNCYGNPSSAHRLGYKAEQKLREYRNSISKFINCSKEEIFFTSGGSESNNFLIRGFAHKGGHIITTKIEHPSVINTCKELEKQGVSITYLNVNSEGKIDLEELKNSIKKDTQVISIMHVNNEIGVIQDIESIGRIIKENSNRAKFHVDAVQSFGKLTIDVQKSKIDLLSVSAHKIHGPRGIGFAYVRKGLIPVPLIHGGGQESGLRSGTENLSAIAGLHKASEIINIKIEENYEKVSYLKNYFIEKLNEMSDVKINSKVSKDYIPHILSVSFRGVRAEVLLHSLAEKGIYVSNGSACSSKDTKDSSVLLSLGLKDEELKGTLRFSFCEDNTTDEIDYTICELKKSLIFLRRLKR